MRNLLALTLPITLGLVACAAQNDPASDAPMIDPGDLPTVADPATNPGGDLVISGLQPGWLVTTTTMTDGAATTDATIVSDGAPLSIAGAAGTRVFATVTDGDGALIATLTPRSPCSPRNAHALRVPAQYSTIQAAVDAAQPGDTVAVAAGEYTESVVMRPGVCLAGAGASRTVLDAKGEGRSLVDLSVAPGSTVTGFTFRGTTSNVGCADNDPFTCSGDWYRAGVYVSGEGGGRLPFEDGWIGPTQKSPALIFGNVFEDNEIGVMINFMGIGVVRNNVFVHNRSAVVANHFQDHTLIANNVFVDNTELAIGNQAAFLDILGNIIVGSEVAIRFEAVQTGAIRNNLFFRNGDDQRDEQGLPPRFVIGKDGNFDIDPKLDSDYHLESGSPAIDRAGLGGHEPDGTPDDIGVFGGPLASWIKL